MKKICLIATVPMTVRSFLIPIAQYYRERTDWDIAIMCDYAPELEEEMPEGVRYIPVSMRRGISLRGINATNQMVAIFKREKFDFVQYCTPNASFYASIAAKIAKIPVRLYCQWGMVYVSMKGLKRWIFKQMEKSICRNSTWVEPDSFGNLEFSHQEGLYPKEKGSVVWNGSTGGIDLERYDTAQKAAWRQQIREKHGIAQNAVVYGFVGRLNADKGIHELYAAFRELLQKHPDAYLMMIGSSENEKSISKTMAQWAENEPHAVFCGATNRIEQYYAAMDVHVLPSYREGFGSVIIEAEAMQVPVIATAIPGPLEAMCPGVTGLSVKKQDISSLLEAMLRLYDDAGLRERLGKAGREYVEERFEISQFYARTLADREMLIRQAEKKKICFVTTVPITLKSFVVELAKHFHQHTDYEITFICNDDPAFAASLPSYVKFIPVSMERGISLGGIGAMLKMARIFRQERFDLVQYSTPNASFYASLAAWLVQVPVRLYCQWGMAYVGFEGLKRKVFKCIEKTVCRLSTWVEPDSHGNLDFSHTEGLYPSNKGSVIWNGSASGVNLTKFDISNRAKWRKEKRVEYQIPENAFVYGFIGRITGDKGINELFTAFRNICEKYPDAYLMMVGDPEKADSVDADLYAWAEHEPHVLFCGFTNVVEQYLSAMDVYVLPSYREGFGSAVIEAEAIGLPVIVTDIPGPTNAMLRDKTGLVVPKKDAALLQTAMEQLLRDASLCRRFGEEGYRFASENFEQKALFGYILEDRKRLLGER